jgi:phosphate transport system permease protein
VGAVTGRLADRGSFLDVGQLDERFTAMPMVISTWVQQSRPGFQEAAAAAIVVLLAVVLVANAAAIILRNRFEKRK